MRLLSSTDFALRVLIVLASDAPGVHVSVETLNHLHKIVQDLTALGITRTLRGAGGGVMLAMPPEEIRLGALIRQLEEDQAIVECFRAGECSCTLMPGCRLRGMLREAQDRFHDSLDQQTLADCLPPVAPGRRVSL
jgi:Rrf2 family nitric oxide-sensitive transcriptional repressor